MNPAISNKNKILLHNFGPLLFSVLVILLALLLLHSTVLALLAAGHCTGEILKLILSTRKYLCGFELNDSVFTVRYLTRLLKEKTNSFGACHPETGE